MQLSGANRNGVLYNAHIISAVERSITYHDRILYGEMGRSRAGLIKAS